MKTLHRLFLVSLVALSGCAAHNIKEGGQCKATSDCVKPLACSGGTCVRERHSSGHKCEVDADCSGVLRCIDLKCM